MRLIPAAIVDRLPVDWWRPGNLHMSRALTLHFCDDDYVRTIEVNGRIVGQGKRLFPYGRWDHLFPADDNRDDTAGRTPPT